MDSNINISAVKGGALIGLVSIILMMLVYVIDVNLLVDWKFSIASLILIIVLFVVIGKKYRNEYMEGFMRFGEAFKFVFIGAIISSILVSIFSIILYNVIDPELPEIITEQALKNTESMMESFGTPSETIDETLEQMEEDMANNFSAGGILANSWAWLLAAAFYGLIAGAIIKKSKPEFE